MRVCSLLSGLDEILGGVPARLSICSNFGGSSSDYQAAQNAPILSLACSFPYGLAAGTELTNHQASVLIW